MIFNKFYKTVDRKVDGFNFSNNLRNADLKNNGYEQPELHVPSMNVRPIVLEPIHQGEELASTTATRLLELKRSTTSVDEDEPPVKKSRKCNK